VGGDQAPGAVTPGAISDGSLVRLYFRVVNEKSGPEK